MEPPLDMLNLDSKSSETKHISTGVGDQKKIIKRIKKKLFPGDQKKLIRGSKKNYSQGIETLCVEGEQKLPH